MSLQLCVVPSIWISPRSCLPTCHFKLQLYNNSYFHTEISYKRKTQCFCQSWTCPMGEWEVDAWVTYWREYHYKEVVEMERKSMWLYSLTSSTRRGSMKVSPRDTRLIWQARLRRVPHESPAIRLNPPADGNDHDQKWLLPNNLKRSCLKKFWEIKLSRRFWYKKVSIWNHKENRQGEK